MKKTAFLNLEQAQTIAAQIPTPFHIYDEAGIRRNARALKAAFSWNKGFREYFAVKATPKKWLYNREDIDRVFEPVPHDAEWRADLAYVEQHTA